MSIAGHVSLAMLSRNFHARMEAKRWALDEIAARWRAAEEKRRQSWTETINSPVRPDVSQLRAKVPPEEFHNLPDDLARATIEREMNHGDKKSPIPRLAMILISTSLRLDFPVTQEFCNRRANAQVWIDVVCRQVRRVMGPG
jgi:hypothetical protein